MKRMNADQRDRQRRKATGTDWPMPSSAALSLRPTIRDGQKKQKRQSKALPHSKVQTSLTTAHPLVSGYPRFRQSRMPPSIDTTFV
jgi:hypothetical protein